MITPQIVGASKQLRGSINATDLATLLSAIGSANIVQMPEGKTLADLTRLNVVLMPPLPDGSPRVGPDGEVANVFAEIRA